MSLARILVVFRFEARRSLTAARLAWWLALTLFPVGIVALLMAAGAPITDRDFWTAIFFFLCPFTVCLLGLLLWAPSLLQSELEANTWGYLAVRPEGKLSMLFGKYLTAVSWTVLSALVGLTLAIVVARPDSAFHIWSVLAVLVVLSSLSYGALFVFLGVLAHKRAMVSAVAYALILEFIIGTIPATINKLTVYFRLRTLLFEWIDWKYTGANQTIPLLSDSGLIGEGPAWHHVLILLAYTTVLLAAATYLIRTKELVPSGD